MSIINSVLDTDLYKLSMQKAVLDYAPNTLAKYKFFNRRPEGKFTKVFEEKLDNELKNLETIGMTLQELQWLKINCPFLDEQYLTTLYNYTYNSDEVKFEVKDGELNLEIEGYWHTTILWEVQLMAIISELYFKYCDTEWMYQKYGRVDTKLYKKCDLLKECTWCDFGTRRRRSYILHDYIINLCKNKKGFMGTSNVHLAMKYNLKPIGTMAHEWIMGISALEGLRHANKHALKIWANIYKGNLGIALTDTFGSMSFFKDFNLELAKLYDGVRQDSGDPYVFGYMVIQHYKDLNIDPKTKTIIFSDSLTAELAKDLHVTFNDKINVSFGIGTNLTNDFRDSPALNMVIKMVECDRVPVVKLGDGNAKRMGSTDALKVADWTFFNQPIK